MQGWQKALQARSRDLSGAVSHGRAAAFLLLAFANTQESASTCACARLVWRRGPGQRTGGRAGRACVGIPAGVPGYWGGAWQEPASGCLPFQ
eukprot:scaffold280820_cov22-Tisochrysis_lutea.AAC.1